MNLGFADQFVPYVLDGSKTHTIRAGFRWKVGMRAYLFAETRRRKVFDYMDGEYQQVSGMRLLFRAMVTKVESIEIMCFPEDRPDGWPSASIAPLYAKTKIAIEGIVLSEDECNVFAWRDGFRKANGHTPFRQMVNFWASQHGFGRRTVRFHGQIIHWDYEQRFMEKRRNPRLDTKEELDAYASFA